MWFKNLKTYHLTSPLSLDADSLENALAEFSFRPCGQQDTATMGFSSPFAAAGMRNATSLHHAANGNFWLCLKKQERILPAAVVNAELAEKVADIEAQTGAPVGKKAQQDLKQEIVFKLLPQSFTKNSYTHAMIATQHDKILVEASSDGQAEAFLAYLRKALTSVPAIPLVRQSLQSELTQWLTDKAPEKVVLLEEAELKSISEEGAIIRCKNQDLHSDEINLHLESGKLVQKLAIEWDERLSCLIHEDGSVKRIKFTDVVKEQTADIPKDEIAAKLDADFALMSGEILAFIENMITVLALNND
ncbi:recombination-associated protein RdgC [Alteromonas oceanisediminis]|uniref:recombination-associated protein RdgC n=1 Tax=Alteromonas oceanisediminis TaxID=2836180 RepID=UPI001BDA7A71|nr:recombination-associated protein RdgC [Alteromonas oceanisediminis]MBT0585296.1 recombination-associated protein RdgC [Alteromonas oceanisediminis]